MKTLHGVIHRICKSPLICLTQGRVQPINRKLDVAMPFVADGERMTARCESTTIRSLFGGAAFEDYLLMRAARGL